MECSVGFLHHRFTGGYKTGNMCDFKTGIMCGYKTSRKFSFKNSSKSAKGNFCGNDFYKTNHSKIHEIRPITPKSDWPYNHPLYLFIYR